MKFVLLLALALGQVSAGPTAVNKVVELLKNMRTETEAAISTSKTSKQKWDVDSAVMVGDSEHSITNDKDDIEAASACKSDSAAKVDQLNGNVGALAGSVSKDEAEKKKTEDLNAEQKADCVANLKELNEAKGQLVAAAKILKRIPKDHNAVATAAFAQFTSMMNVVMNAASIEAEDKQQLSALVQAAQDGDDDEEVSAPAQGRVTAYQSHTGDLMNMLADLKSKCESKMQSMTMNCMKQENENRLLIQGLSDKIADEGRQMSADKQSSAEQSSVNAKCSGDLDSSNASLKSNEDYLASLNQQIKDKQTAYNDDQKTWAAEVDALGKAIEILSNPEALAAHTAVADASFLQTSDDGTRGRLVTIVQNLARKYHSVGLAQLAVRVNEDPFAKVKTLIEDMINRLQKQANQEASKKAYCDEEMKKTKAKQAKLHSKIEGTDARLDRANSDLSMLAESISKLSTEAAELSSNLAEMTKTRQDDAAEAATLLNQMATSLQSLMQANGVLREFYQSNQGLGNESSTGVLGLIETVIDDTTTEKSNLEMNEEKANADFTKFKQESEVRQASIDAEVKAKKGEQARLTNTEADLKNDAASLASEMEATDKYWSKLQDTCVHKVMTFAERSAKMQAEIEGLQDALRILNEESAGADSFLQKRA